MSIRLTSNTAGVDDPAPECIVYFDRGPKGRHLLAPGDVIAMYEAGGGGFGDPKARHPHDVLRDVRKDQITARGAQQGHAVDVDLDAGAATRRTP